MRHGPAVGARRRGDLDGRPDASRSAGSASANPILHGRRAAGPRRRRRCSRCAEGGAGGLVSKTISIDGRDAADPEHRRDPARHGQHRALVRAAARAVDRARVRDRAHRRPAARSSASATPPTTSRRSPRGSGRSPTRSSSRPTTSARTPGRWSRRSGRPRRRVDVPVFVKLSPLGREMARAAEQAEAAGADGIVAINSFGPVLAIDPVRAGPGWAAPTATAGCRAGAQATRDALRPRHRAGRRDPGHRRAAGSAAGSTRSRCSWPARRRSRSAPRPSCAGRRSSGRSPPSSTPGSTSTATRRGGDQGPRRASARAGGQRAAARRPRPLQRLRTL